MEENKHTIVDKQHLEMLINRVQAQRNDALDRIALLEAELIKAQNIIKELENQKNTEN